MRPIFLLLPAIVLTLRCAAPAPPEPEPVPRHAPVQQPAPAPAVNEPAIGTVYVTASTLNVRGDASMEAEIVSQAKRGEELSLLRDEKEWLRVRRASGETGWVASRFVSRRKIAERPKGGCPPDSDYEFVQRPPFGFSERGPHGLVVVEAKVDARGNVTSTRIVSNNTGDTSLGLQAQREIEAAKFSPPILDCKPRAFIFTYRRSF